MLENWFLNIHYSLVNFTRVIDRGPLRGGLIISEKCHFLEALTNESHMGTYIDI